MKRTIFTVAAIACTCATLLGDTYSYPDSKRPVISLGQSCQIAESMLRTQGLHERYFITQVSLLGDKAQSGAGGWNLCHFDKDGNKVNAYIPFPQGELNLHFYPHDYAAKGGDRIVTFIRKGLEVEVKQIRQNERLKD